jgi:hypothetical protein
MVTMITIRRRLVLAVSLLSAASGGFADAGRRPAPDVSYFPKDAVLEFVSGYQELLTLSPRLPANARMAEVIDGDVRLRDVEKDGGLAYSGGAYLVTVNDHEVRIFVDRGNERFVQQDLLKRDLKPGMAWSASWVPTWGLADVATRTYAVSAERLPVGAGRTLETLRVDVSVAGIRRESLWLARGVGIVRWDAERHPGSLFRKGYVPDFEGGGQEMLQLRC